jgi:hypothetical protein
VRPETKPTDLLHHGGQQPTAVVEDQRAGQALVSFLVSFVYVRNRSARTTENRLPRSRTLLTFAGLSRADVLETVAVHDRIVGRTRAGRAAPAGPARCGQDGQPSEPRQGSAVLTDLLTTTLDHHGHGRTEKPREQGRRDCLDSRGRP